MALKKQFSVCLPNQPGQLARLCGVLRQAKVNIVAMSVADASDACIVRMICDKGPAALAALKKRKIDAIARDVVAVQLPNTPGALEKAANKLARAKINIDYVYGSTHAECAEAMCIFAVDDARKANKVLG